MKIRKDLDLLEIQSMFKGEEYKGLLIYLGSSTFANSLNYILGNTFKYSIGTSTFISLYLVGNILTYCLDILYAKKYFWDSTLNRYIDYKSFTPKFKWLLKSFIDKYFFKFFITVLLDSIIGIAILKRTIKLFNDNNLFMNYKYRNYIIAAIIGAFTFVLYLNALRFNWAYTNIDNPILNIVIIMWFSLALLIVVKIDEQSNPDAFKDTGTTAKYFHSPYIPI